MSLRSVRPSSAHVDGDHAVPDGLVPAAGSETRVTPDHHKPTAALGHKLHRPLKLLRCERRPGDIAANDHVILEQLLARRRISPPRIINALKDLALGILVVDQQRGAPDARVFLEPPGASVAPEVVYLPCTEPEWPMDAGRSERARDC